MLLSWRELEQECHHNCDIFLQDRRYYHHVVVLHCCRYHRVVVNIGKDVILVGDTSYLLSSVQIIMQKLTVTLTCLFDWKLFAGGFVAIGRRNVLVVEDWRKWHRCLYDLLLEKLFLELFIRVSCTYLPPKLVSWQYFHGKRRLCDNLVCLCFSFSESTITTNINKK